MIQPDTTADNFPSSVYTVAGKQPIRNQRTVRTKKMFIPVFFLILLCTGIGAEESIVLGDADRWRDLISWTRVIQQTGWKGTDDLVLRDEEYHVGTATDFLLHFNSGNFTDFSGKYMLTESRISTNENYKVFGQGAGVFQREEIALSYEPSPLSLLGPGSVFRDFTIEFWLYPAILEDGETILLWEGNRQEGSTIFSQAIRCSIEERRILWQFDNFFRPSGGGPSEFSVTATATLIPRRWRHHMIRFDSSTGLLEYRVNDIPEAILYITDSGREGGSVYLPVIGSTGKNSLNIGSGFTGFLDEMRISSRIVDSPQLTRYRNRAGSAITRVFDLTYNNSRLISINSEFSTPGDTDVAFYYRMADTMKGWNNLPSSWKIFTPGDEFLPTTRGRYMQVRMDLLPDGSGSQSPVVSQCTIRYEPDLPPHPPASVRAVPGDGSVSLNWQAVPEHDIGGYLIFYGKVPGQYFGTGTDAGDSPIDVGNSTSFSLTGLENGSLYYFTVVAYDSTRNLGDFSREISARPSEVYRGD